MITHATKVALLDWTDTVNLTDITDKFKFDGHFETGSDESCSFQLHNQMYIIGGTYESPFARQISIVKPHALVKSGVILPEDFTAPSCQSIDDVAYICSPYNHKNWCYQVVYSGGSKLIKYIV